MGDVGGADALGDPAEQVELGEVQGGRDGQAMQAAKDGPVCGLGYREPGVA